MELQIQFEFKELLISEINADPGVQSRESLNTATVKDYAEAFSREGVTVPAVTVFYDGTTYWLADGFHRIAAFTSMGRPTIGANIYPGGRREAVLHSLGSNAEHGLPRTHSDKQKVVRIVLSDAEWAKWSDSEIANRCKVSRPFVAKIRSSLVNVASEKIYKTKHGTVSTMKTENIGRKREATPDEDPALGRPTPMSREQEQEIRLSELCDTVSQLVEENTVLKDKIAIGQWDATEIEKVDAEDLIRELREKIRILEIENAALRDSRDMFQNRNSELIRQVKALQSRIKKAGI